MNIQCFLLEPSEWVRDGLRRYSASRLPDGRDNQRTCPLMAGQYSYHNASVEIGDRLEPEEICHGLRIPMSDARWPEECACGYVFEDWDEWQFNAHRLYNRVGTGERMPLHSAPAGAMWYADWMTESRQGEPGDLWHGPDGRCLAIRTPGGDWLIDGPSSTDHAKCPWTRTGRPPTISVTPSIICGSYHGWLTEGQLID